MANRLLGQQQGLLGFRGAARKDKVGSILRLGGIACIALGVAWTVCYIYFDRLELSAVFVFLAAIGVIATMRSTKCDGSSLLVVAHGIYFAIFTISLIDAPLQDVGRSVHLFLLPLAAGAAFTFEPRERYGSLVFPLICLLTFSGFTLGAFDGLSPGISPPREVRLWGGRSNTAIAMLLLIAVFTIYRIDFGKRLKMERELGRAVRNGEIVVHYQPQVRDSGVVTGAEALVRWRHPVRGILSPDTFIPLAEDSLLIHEIGLEVLRQCCETLKFWSTDEATSRLRISLNVSPFQLLDPAFVSSFSRVIEEAQVKPELIELELTESALASDSDHVVRKMRDIQKLGLTWALDDFGTGYSTLATLRTLPVAKMKIDRRFVDGAVGQECGKRLLGKIVEISQVMEMSALAEGVETAEQRSLLVSLGCDHFQGYLFAKPMPLSSFNEWLRQRVG